MKIIRVPQHKKLTKLYEYNTNQNNPQLNEGFFDNDDNEEIFSDNTDDDLIQNNIYQEIEKDDIPKVEEWLNQNKIESYDIRTTGKGIEVDVHEHLSLPNHRLLSIPNIFRFNAVEGNCNFANNKFTSFKFFPRIIYGDCNASFNYISDFSFAPVVHGKMYALKQKVRTKYPLSHENYLKYIKNPDAFIQERQIVQLKNGEYGSLIGINERTKLADILIDNGPLNENRIIQIPFNEVNVINGVSYLNNLINSINGK